MYIKCVSSKGKEFYRLKTVSLFYNNILLQSRPPHTTGRIFLSIFTFYIYNKQHSLVLTGIGLKIYTGQGHCGEKLLSGWNKWYVSSSWFLFSMRWSVSECESEKKKKSNLIFSFYIHFLLVSHFL